MFLRSIATDYLSIDIDQTKRRSTSKEMTSISVPTDPQDPGWVRCKNRWKRRCDWHVRTAETGPDGTCFSGIVFERHRAHFRLPACKGILEGRNWTRVGAFIGQKSVTQKCPKKEKGQQIKVDWKKEVRLRSKVVVYRFRRIVENFDHLYFWNWSRFSLNRRRDDRSWQRDHLGNLIVMIAEVEHNTIRSETMLVHIVLERRVFVHLQWTFGKIVQRRSRSLLV